MEQKVFIIHRSEIIRKGIVAILRNYFHLDYIQLSVNQDLKLFSQLKENFIIVFQEYIDSLNQSELYKLKKKNKLKSIGVCNEEVVSNNILGFNHCISVNTRAKEITDLVSTLINQTEQNKTRRSEGEELSVREKDVLKLVALGNTNKEIANKLYISIHTVISHRKNITEKLGIKSISGLTVYALLNKLIDTESIDPEQLI